VLDLLNVNAFFHGVVARSSSHRIYLKVEKFSPELVQGIWILKGQPALVIRVPWGRRGEDAEALGHPMDRATEEEVGRRIALATRMSQKLGWRTSGRSSTMITAPR